MTKRNSSFELLKVIAIIFVCASSALPYGAMYQGSYLDVYVNLNNVNSLYNTSSGIDGGGIADTV